MLTLVDATCPLPSVAWDVIVQEVWVKGAVKRAEAVIAPQEDVCVAPLLVVNCCVAPSITVGFTGLIVKFTAAAIVSKPNTVYFGEPVEMPSMVQDFPTDPLAE